MHRLGFGVYDASENEIVREWAGKAEADRREMEAVREAKRKGRASKNMIGKTFGKR